MTKLKQMNNLQQRIIAGVTGSFIIIVSIIYSPWTYFGIFLLMVILCMLELYGLFENNKYRPNKWVGLLSGVLLFTLSFLIEKGDLKPVYYLLFFPVFFVIFLFKLYDAKDDRPFTNIALTIFGVVYAALPFALLNIAAFENGVFKFHVILGSLLLLWASDSGAYFAGKFFGKHKLFERVSPKKTWEGSIGGLVLSILMAIYLSYILDQFPLSTWLILSIIIVVAGGYGDLIESLFKRSISIKDSGSLIPGHGGMLDRFDGLLISAPFIAAFIRLFC